MEHSERKLQEVNFYLTSSLGLLLEPVIKTPPSNTGVAGLIPGWEIRSHMLQGQKKIFS